MVTSNSVTVLQRNVPPPTSNHVAWHHMCTPPLCTHARRLHLRHTQSAIPSSSAVAPSHSKRTRPSSKSSKHAPSAPSAPGRPPSPVPRCRPSTRSVTPHTRATPPRIDSASQGSPPPYCDQRTAQIALKRMRASPLVMLALPPNGANGSLTTCSQCTYVSFRCSNIL